MPDVIDIVVADEHFLYLPLYFARHNNFFGLLPAGTEVNIKRSTLRTDASAFGMLMDSESKKNENIQFAFCDPAEILSYRGNAAVPVVLAGVITNSAFWAVNHNSNRSTFVEHLATFDRVIAFHKGNTSFGIANRIFKDPSKKSSIRTVDPKTELVELSKFGPGTIAISPNILGIQKLLDQPKKIYSVELALGRTPEYRELLVTALISRRDVVLKIPAVVDGLLAALQEALVSVRSIKEGAVLYAVGKFKVEARLVRKALEKANESEVFPPNITISESTWLKVAENYWQARGEECGAERRQSALTTFRLNVEAHADRANKIVRAFEDKGLGLSQATKDVSKKPSILRKGASFGIPSVALLAIGLGVVALASADVSWYGYLALFLIALIAGICAATTLIMPMSLPGLIFWGPLAILQCAVVAVFDFGTAMKTLDSLAPGINAMSEISFVAICLTIVGIIWAEIQYLEQLRSRLPNKP